MAMTWVNQTHEQSVSFLQDLETAVSRGSSERGEQALNYATDVLIAGRYSEDEVWLFGEIIQRLMADLEGAARARLANRMAPVGHAPPNLIKTLAFDDAIEVAGPVLRQSERLDRESLLSVARSKGQDHLLAISKRKSLDEEVTDLLVNRGNRQVAHSVASNAGARFSGASFLGLVKRSENDSILAETLGTRHDIPRRLFQQLIAKASDELGKKLESEMTPSVARSSVVEATGEMHSKFGPASKEYFAAKRAITAKHRCGALDENEIFDFARSYQFEAATIGLSLLSGVAVHVVERALTEKSGDTLLILTKAIGFSWPTTMALLFLGAQEHKLLEGHVNNLGKQFCVLSKDTAQRVLQTYRSRKADNDRTMERRPQLHSA